MLAAIEQHEFLRSALAAGIVSAAICAFVGSWIVVNRMVFLSGGISHAAYGGIGLAVYLGCLPFHGALFFSVAVAVVIAWLAKVRPHRVDTTIGMLWAIGMSMGVVLTDLTPGYRVDLHSFLFGSILSVTPTDLRFMLGSAAAIVVILAACHRPLLALSYDEEYARTRGIRTGLLRLMLLVVTAIAIVILMRVAGLVLGIALLTIGPYIAERRAGSIWSMIGVAFALNALFVVLGLWISYAANVSTGPAIILVAGAAFLATEIFELNR